LKLKAVVIAAGQGVRLLPITETKPKHMVPIGGKPVIEHIVDCLASNRIEELLLVVGYRKETIQQYLGNGEQIGVKVDYVVQAGVLGTGHAVGLAERYVGDGDFLVVNGDLLITPETIGRVLKTHEQSPSKTVMAVVPVPNAKEYGIVSLDGDRVVEIAEKPESIGALGNLANAGLYVFKKNIFGAIEETPKSVRGEFEITDSVRILIEKGVEIHAARIDPSGWMDIGCPWDLLEANKRVLEKAKPKIDGEVEDGAKLVGPIIVSNGARVKSGAYIEGPIFIGEYSEIGPNCHIRPFTSIGKNVKIGNACEVKNSIIMDGTKIPHLSYVGDSVIGENCNFGAGTNIANLRLDDKTVRMVVGGKLVDSGRRKLGAIVGDNVKTAINVSFMPGVKVGSNTLIGSNVIVHRDLPSGVLVLQKQELEFEKQRM